jgi:hypothetical protein
MSQIHSAQALDSIGPRSSLVRLLLVLLAATALDITAHRVLEQTGLGLPARLAAALLPLPGNITLLVMILRRARRLDEFQKRLQFEAVVVGFLATGVAVFVYSYLQKAYLAGALNMGLVWVFMLVFYGIGYFVAVNHYK